MAYNSAYTGQQIDAAVGAVTQKESTWDDKQDALSGTEDQIVGFNSAGNATPIPKPIGLPEGGTTGQMLYQGASGPEWGDKPVMYVHITGDDDSGYQADKTAQEIYEAVQDGYSVFAIITMGGETAILPVVSAVENGVGIYVALFQLFSNSKFIHINVARISGADQVIYKSSRIPANKITFNPGTTGLEATNVQDAIEEVNEKIPSAPKSVSITLPASGWSSNTQTVTVSGVSADETAQLIQPMPAVASQVAYMSAGIYCSGQAANSLTFTCQNVPTEDLTVYVVMQEVGA